MESEDSKWCADMGYRDDDFRRDQDRQYENFRDDLAWKQKVRDRDSSLAREALRRGQTAWALHHIGATDAAIDLLRSGTGAPDYSDMAQECIDRGVRYLEQELPALALDDFDKSLELTGERGETLCRGVALHRLGRLHEGDAGT